MAQPLLPQPLWQEIEPLLPPERAKPKGGRPAVANHACLTGIIFVLRTGVPWRLLPQELGCGSGVTCWRRLRDWAEAGVWPKVHAKLVHLLGRRGRLDRDLAVIDSASVRAVKGGHTPGRTPPTGPKRAASATS
jgi:transposase